MNLIQKFSISENEVLNSINFLEKVDYIYSALLPKEIFLKKFRRSDVEILFENNYEVYFRNLKFEINSNELIFSHTDLVSELFYILKKNPKLKNLKLITGQSDFQLSHRIYKLKPSNIEKWFSTNNNLEIENLYCLPLGISNISYDNKYVVYSDFVNYQNYVEKNDKLIYSNFNLNTNYFHRIKTKPIISKQETIFENNLDKNSYLDAIHKFKYQLCPWGNGIDTHRFWETIYSGNVPIVLKNNMYKQFSDFPSIIIDDYKNLKIDQLFKIVEDANFNKDKLKVSWWIDRIKNDKTETKTFSLFINLAKEESTNKIFFKKRKLLLKQRKTRKKINTFFRKVHRKYFLYSKFK